MACRVPARGRSQPLRRGTFCGTRRRQDIAAPSGSQDDRRRGLAGSSRCPLQQGDRLPGPNGARLHSAAGPCACRRVRVAVDLRQDPNPGSRTAPQAASCAICHRHEGPLCNWFHRSHPVPPGRPLSVRPPSRSATCSGETSGRRMSPLRLLPAGYEGFDLVSQAASVVNDCGDRLCSGP